MLCRVVRAALSGAFFLGYGLFALPFAPVLMLPVWSPKAVRRVIRVFYRAFVFFAGCTGLYRVRVEGGIAPRRRDGRGRIVVSNHVSLIDVCILMAVLGDSTAIAKAATLKNPFLSMVVRKMFLVNDRDPVECIGEVRKLLDEGVNLIVFPQGTRGGERWHRGAARLALACGAEIEVYRLEYDPPVLTKHQPWWDVGDKIIRIAVRNNGIITRIGASSHHNAVALTEEIREMVVRT